MTPGRLPNRESGPQNQPRAKVAVCRFPGTSRSMGGMPGRSPHSGFESRLSLFICLSPFASAVSISPAYLQSAGLMIRTATAVSRPKAAAACNFNRCRRMAEIAWVQIESMRGFMLSFPSGTPIRCIETDCRWAADRCSGPMENSNQRMRICPKRSEGKAARSAGITVSGHFVQR